MDFNNGNRPFGPRTKKVFLPSLEGGEEIIVKLDPNGRVSGDNSREIKEKLLSAKEAVFLR